MKCKSCGQNLVFDKKSGIARCPDCRRTYKVSVVGKPKDCPKCHVTLVDKGTFWQCPNCSNKYVFAPKSDMEKSTENKRNGVNNSAATKNKHNNVNDSSTSKANSQELDPKYVLVEENDDIDENVSIKLDVDDIESVLEPKLYDYDGTEYVPDKPANAKKGKKGSNAVTLSKMEHYSEIISGKKSKVGLFFAVLLGILITISGIISYLSLSSIVEWLTIAVYTYAIIVFFAVFTVICIAVAFKPIGAKRIGVLMAAIYGICMLLSFVFEYLINIEFISVFLSAYGNILTYSAYGLLLLGSFIMMVVNCKGEFHRKSTSAGVVFFVFSLLALLVLAMWMLPLDKYNLEVLEPIKSYIHGIDNVLVMFASYPLLSVLAKPRQ